MPRHFQRLAISASDLKRWETAAFRLPTVPELLLGIYSVGSEPSQFQLEQAANVARYAASVAAGANKDTAIALAEELERRAAS